MSKELHKKLAEIQQKLKAPKNQMNKFGGYAYRSCEDILEAVKPLLGDLSLIISDEMVVLPDYNNARYYVKATAVISDGEHSISNTAFAREEESKKGMDASQLTGSTSSYARKYALNGLFLIDDTKDADATNDPGKEAKEPPKKPEAKSNIDAKDSFRKPKTAPKQPVGGDDDY